MIKFEEHEGKLFRMLDKPVPLTKDAKMPCLVRLIQDDSPMGRHNKFAFSPLMKNNNPIIIDSIKENAVSIAFNHMVFHYSNFEIIGYPVADGSKEWAWYQMMQGEAVTFFDQPNRILRLVNGYIQDSISDGFWNRKSGNEFLSYASSPGWQIYKEPEQPKTMPVNEFADLFDAPIGWVCKTRDGGSFPLKYIEVSPTRYAYEDKSGLTVYVMANGRYKKNGTDGRDIISFEPEQPKPESENIIHGYIPADMRLKYFHLCKFKVGDWVTDGVVVGHVAVINDGNAWVKTKDAQYHLSVEHLRKLKPSEIVVRIGCLSGTIEKSCDPSYFLMRHSRPATDCNHSMIRFSAIDTETRSLVESLLKAQGEESQ